MNSLSLRVAIVEDGDVLTRRFASALGQPGFSVETISCSAPALERTSQFDPHVLLALDEGSRCRALDFAYEVKLRSPACYICLFSGETEDLSPLLGPIRLGDQFYMLPLPETGEAFLPILREMGVHERTSRSHDGSEDITIPLFLPKA